MARDTMIYDDKALTATTAETLLWPTAWDPDSASMCSGKGLIIEGVLQAKPTRLLITDTKGKVRSQGIGLTA